MEDNTALKTLATCKPSEFLYQTNRIRKNAEKWIRDTRIFDIRKTQPDLEVIPKDASPEEKVRIFERNREKSTEQSMKNLSEMLDAILEERPRETLELLALCCFVEPENVDDHPMRDYLDAFTSLINDRAVISFFTSLATLGQTLTLKESKE